MDNVNKTHEMSIASSENEYTTPNFKRFDEREDRFLKIFKQFTWRRFMSVFALVACILLVLNLAATLASIISVQNKLDDILETVKASENGQTSKEAQNGKTTMTTTSKHERTSTATPSITTTMAIQHSSAPMKCCNAERISVDLTTGTVSGNLEAFGASEIAPFTVGSDCDSRGVIKITFEYPAPCRPSCNHRTLRVDMKPHKTLRDQNLFDIGDSPSNNGYAGDFADNSWDAEIQGVKDTISIWTNDYCPASKLYQSFPGAISPGVSQATVKVDDGYIRVMNSSGLDKGYRDDQCLFGLNGQYDNEAGGRNDFNVYVAFNRVIYPDRSRYGRGLCSAELSWECCNQERN